MPVSADVAEMFPKSAGETPFNCFYEPNGGKLVGPEDIFWRKHQRLVEKT